jgi:hypothetical protein
MITSYHISSEGFKIYTDGVLMLTIPIEDFGHLIRLLAKHV